MSDVIRNPLGDTADRARRDEVERVRVELAIGKARKSEEWFDIFQSVVEHGVKTIAEDNGEQALERIQAQRGVFAEVRHIIKYQGLSLTEAMEWEGPEYIQDEHGFYHGITWPRGEWLKVIWPDRDVVELRGQKALIMATFLLWWQQFQQLATTQQDLIDGKEAPRRLIEPGSPEWTRYFMEKQKDMERMERESRGDPS